MEFITKSRSGCESTFIGKRAKGFAIKEFLNIVGFYKIHALPVMVKGLKTEQIIQPPKNNEVCIVHLGIAENYRGLGLGRKLIAFLMEASKPKPTNRFVLDVSEENPKAQFLYERLGFKVLKCNYSKLKNSFGYVANHYRMELWN